MSVHTVDSDHYSIPESTENRNDNPSRASRQSRYSLQRWSEEPPRESIWSSFNLRTTTVQVRVVEESLEEWREMWLAPSSMVMSFESALLSQLGHWHGLSMRLYPSLIFWLKKDTCFSNASLLFLAQKPAILSHSYPTINMFEDSLLGRTPQTRRPSPGRSKSPSLSEGSVPSWTIGSTESSDNCAITSEHEGNAFPQIMEDASTWDYPKLNEKPWEGLEGDFKANKTAANLRLDSTMLRSSQHLHLCVFTTTIDPVVERPVVERPQMPSNSSSHTFAQIQPNSSDLMDESHAFVKRKPSPVTESENESNSIKRLKVCPDPLGENSSGVAFGCPFCKANPQRYRRVRGACTFPPGFDMKRMTEHLKRNHSSKHCCKNCRKRFTGAAEKAQRELVEHINRGGCNTKLESVAEPEWMSEKQEEVFDLDILKRSRTTEEEKWKAIYRFLFPERSFVPSPYYDYYILNPGNFVSYNARNQDPASQSYHSDNKIIPNTNLHSPLEPNTPSTSSSYQDATAWYMPQSTSGSQEHLTASYIHPPNSLPNPQNPTGVSQITLAVRPSPAEWQSSSTANKDYSLNHFGENCMSSLNPASPSTEYVQPSHHPLSSTGLGEESPSTHSGHIPDSGYGSQERPKVENEERNNPELSHEGSVYQDELEEDLFALWVDEKYHWNMPSFALLPSSIDFADESPSRLRRNNVFDRVSSPIRLFE